MRQMTCLERKAQHGALDCQYRAVELEHRAWSLLVEISEISSSLCSSGKLSAMPKPFNLLGRGWNVTGFDKSHQSRQDS